METQKTRIKFENGEEKTINIFSLDMSKIKKDLEKLSGLKFGKGDYVTQAYGMAHSWMLSHSPEDKLTDKAMYAALFVAIIVNVMENS